MKILVVDDDELVLSMVQLFLAEAGYKDVTLCSMSDNALHEIENEDINYECFFFDIIMPFVHGIEMCKRVRDIPKYKETPIIMLTAISSNADIDEAFAAGATDYLTKPFTINEIGARVRIAENLVSVRKNSSRKNRAKLVVSNARQFRNHNSILSR